ncbi:MAG: hypothetical protein LBB30_02035 [Candidatus Methanoplasma sp.]|jgi:hypothetical protein|nr:hypothetical protein [Candidatus Methanoplasma sp.]
MRLKDKKGMTAMVDAMIFIVIMGMAVSAMFSFGGENPVPNDASSVSDCIFSSKLRMCDLVDTEESGPVSIPDMAAFYILTGEGKTAGYLESILDSLFQRPGSYRLDIEYQGSTMTVGSGKGEAVSGSVKEFAVTYGGSIRTELRIF